jgi:hypothetical protein
MLPLLLDSSPYTPYRACIHAHCVCGVHVINLRSFVEEHASHRGAFQYSVLSKKCVPSPADLPILTHASTPTHSICFVRVHLSRPRISPTMPSTVCA